MTTKALFAFALCFVLQACGTATCSPCGDSSIVCTDTVQACIEDGGGVCKTGGPGNLELLSDDTFRQEFGAGTQTGTWVETAGSLQLTSGGQVVGNVPVAEGATCQLH